MRWNKTADLLIMETTQNDNGFDEEVVKEKKTVFANKLSVRSSEFYQASQQGYSLSLVLEVRTTEYNEEEHLDFENKRYEIVRTYEKGEKIELICQSYGKVEVV